MGRRRVPQVAYETCRKLSLRDMMIHWELPKKKRSIRRTRKPIGIQPNSITNKHALLSVWGKTKSRSFRCFRGRYGNGEQLALTIESALTIYNTRMSDPEAVTGDAIHSSSSFSAAADAEPSCPPAPARSTRISTIYTPCPALVANREAAQQAHFFLPYFDTFASMCNKKQAEQYGFEDLGCGHEAAATYRMQGQSFTSLLTSSNTELLWRQQILRGQQQEREDDHPQANDSGYYCASAEFELSRPVTGAERASGGVSGEPQAPVTPEKKQQPKKAAAATGRTGGRKRPLKDNKVPHSPSTPVAISSNLSFNLPEKNLFDLNELPDPKGRPRKHRPRVAKDKPPKTPRKRGRPRKKQHQEDDPAQQQQQQQQQQAETIEIFVSSYVRNSSNARMEWELSHGVQGHFIEANKRKGNGSSLESQRKRAKADSALSGLQSQPQPKRGYDLLNSDAQQGLNDELVYLMEKLIEGMKKMQLDSEVGLEIVEYKGFSGPVVPFIPPKKKKPRAKVVLDMETNRMWNLLMIKGAKQEEHVDQDAAKRWQRDRLMMGQRADLFISRMHLVQGDRRFSKWKGSVVDSVVGAFLTQNVSDHLSSSAFMAVASRFPINKDPSNSRNGGCIPQNCGHCLGTSTPKKEEARIKVQARIKKRRNSHGLVQEEDNLYKQEGVPDSGLKVKRALFAEEEVSPSKEKVSTEDQVFIQETRSDVCSVVEMGSHIKSYAVQIEDLNSTCIFQESCNGGLTKVDNVDNAGGGTEERPCTGIPCSCQDKQSLTTNGAGNLNMKGSQTVASEMPERLNGKVKPSGIDLANLEHSQGTSKNSYKWDTLRSKVLKNQDYNQNEFFKTPTSLPPDSLDWEAVRLADVKEVADVIKERGMNNILAGRIKAFLERVHEEHGTINLEWLREIPPEDAKEFLLSIRGLGLKSVECIRLLTLEHLAFPVDTNVGRICVRLGWVPIEPLPEELQLHLLELYPVQATIQKYLWPRLCTLDQRTLYELHYQMITFGKVFCTKSKPNCNACPMRQDCKHFASAFASARLALPAPPQQNGVQEEESSSRLALAESVVPLQTANANGRCEPASSSSQAETVIRLQNVSASEANERCEPIIEEPSTPEPCCSECPDIEDYPPCLLEDDSILKINLTDVGETDKEEVPAAGQRSKALVLVPPEFAYIPVPKLKYEGRLRTVHYVYELPDNHPLLHEMDARETDDPCFYLLAIWSPEEELEAPPTLSECDYSTFTEGKESNEETIKGTLLVPCRSAMRGSFPLNGTYFQVNEVFADQATSLQPMDVPRASLWNLRRRFVYFGTSVTSIFRGLTTEEIQACFWRGYVCVRGFDRRTRAPRPLAVRFHLPASKKVAVAKKSGN